MSFLSVRGCGTFSRALGQKCAARCCHNVMGFCRLVAVPSTVMNQIKRGTPLTAKAATTQRFHHHHYQWELK